MDTIHVSCFDENKEVNFIFNFKMVLGFKINKKENKITYFTEIGDKVSYFRDIKKELKSMAKILGVRKLESELFLSFSIENEDFYIFNEKVATIQKASVTSNRTLVHFVNTNQILYIDKTLEEIQHIL